MRSETKNLPLSLDGCAAALSLLGAVGASTGRASCDDAGPGSSAPLASISDSPTVMVTMRQGWVRFQRRGQFQRATWIRDAAEDTE